MIVDFQVLAFLGILHGLEEVRFGVFVALLFIKHPAEAIEIGRVVAVLIGIDIRVVLAGLFPLFLILFQRFADELLGLVKVHVVVGPDETQIIIVRGIIW